MICVMAVLGSGRHIRFAAVLWLGFALSIGGLRTLCEAQSKPLGIFEGQSDVGSVEPPGTLVYDPAAQTYTIASAGANLWSTTDGFHFAWKKASGDLSLTADIKFLDSSGNPVPMTERGKSMMDEASRPRIPYGYYGPNSAFLLAPGEDVYSENGHFSILPGRVRKGVYDPA